MKKYFFLIFILNANLTFAYNTYHIGNMNYLETYNLALKNLKNREKAITLFEETIIKNHNFYDAYIELAKLYIKNKMYDEAKTVIQNALKVDNSRPEAFNQNGRLSKKTKNIVSSKNNFYTSIEKDKKYYKPYFNIADIFFDERQYDLAIEYYKKGLKHSKGINILIVYKLIKIYFITNDLKNVVKTYNEYKKYLSKDIELTNKVNSILEKMTIESDGLEYVPKTKYKKEDIF